MHRRVFFLLDLQERSYLVGIELINGRIKYDFSLVVWSLKFIEDIQVLTYEAPLIKTKTFSLFTINILRMHYLIDICLIR